MALWNTVSPFLVKGDVRNEDPFFFLSARSGTFAPYIETISEEHHSSFNLIEGTLCEARQDSNDDKTGYGFRTKKKLEDQHF